MVWFNVDDGFATSPKVLSIPRAQRLPALGLWVTAGSWCARHLTDGAIPAFMLEEWGASVSHGTALVDAGLWRETAKGYQFHDWKSYQQSRSDVEAKRERERERKKAYREKKAGHAEDSPPGVPAGQTAGPAAESGSPNPSFPIPTQPKPISGGAAKRGTTIPEPFIVTAAMREWAAKEVPRVDVDRSTRRFVDYWRAATRNTLKKDWIATWRNWLRKDQEDSESGRPMKQSKDDRALSVVEMGRQLQGDDRLELGA